MEVANKRLAALPSQTAMDSPKFWTALVFAYCVGIFACGAPVPARCSGRRLRARGAQLAMSARPWVPGGPCARGDILCANSRALEYVNSIRAGAGAAPYALGTQAMLTKTVAHAGAMQAAGRIFHQNLTSTELGCGSSFTGENVAQNFVPPPTAEPTDPARICVEQLKTSPLHYANIVSELHAETAMGVIVDDDDRIWCAQTFAKGTAFGQGACEQALSLD